VTWEWSGALRGSQRPYRRRPGPSVAGHRPTQGALLRARGERVRVEIADELLANINLKRVRQIVCVGRVGVTSALLHHAAERGVELAWLYDDGALAARLNTLAGGDPELRLAQYRVAIDEQRAYASPGMS
jgi:CRISPR-associated protein Cas1